MRLLANVPYFVTIISTKRMNVRARGVLGLLEGASSRAERSKEAGRPSHSTEAGGNVWKFK